MSTNRLLDVMNLYYIKRWGRTPTLRIQSVAEHSFHVAALSDELCRRLGVLDVVRLRTVWWAMYHDAPETETTDIPYPVKKPLKMYIDRLETDLCPWYYNAKAEIGPTSIAIISIADKMEELVFLNVWGAGGPRPWEGVTTAKRLLTERTAEAAARFGWPYLRRHVNEMLFQLGTWTTDWDSIPTSQPESQQEPPPPYLEVEPEPES
jgi:hypothetical protein